MKEFDPRTSPMSGDMSGDRTKNADGTHAVSRTANGIRAVSERPAEHTVVVVEQKRKLHSPTKARTGSTDLSSWQYRLFCSA